MKKHCTKCLELKAFDQFYPHKRYKDGMRRWCKDCDKSSRKEWEDAGGKEYMADWSRARRLENTARLLDYLLEHPCVDCGESDPLVLEFDHMTGKNIEVTRLTARTWDVILKEIELCEVRCCNCHRRRTMEHRNMLRYQLMKKRKEFSSWPLEEVS